MAPDHSIVLLVDPDGSDPELWHFVLKVDGVEVPGSAGTVRRELTDGTITSVGERAEWYLTAALLLRDATAREQIRYDMTPQPIPIPPPARTNGPRPRATAGRAKGAGETLADRARRTRPTP